MARKISKEEQKALNLLKERLLDDDRKAHIEVYRALTAVEREVCSEEFFVGDDLFRVVYESHMDPVVEAWEDRGRYGVWCPVAPEGKITEFARIAKALGWGVGKQK